MTSARTHTHTRADTQCQTVPSHLFLIPPQNTLTPPYTLSSSALSFSRPASYLKERWRPVPLDKQTSMERGQRAAHDANTPLE